MQFSHPQILLLQRKEINKCRVKTEKSYSYSPEQLKSGWKNSVTATSSNLNNLVWSSLHTILTSTCILAFIYGACICRESNSVHPTNLFNDSTLAVNGWLFLKNSDCWECHHIPPCARLNTTTVLRQTSLTPKPLLIGGEQTCSIT